MLIVQHPTKPDFYVHLFEDKVGGRITLVPRFGGDAFLFKHSTREVVKTMGELLINASEATHLRLTPGVGVCSVPPSQDRASDLRQLAHRAVDRMSLQELANLRLPVGCIL